MLIGATEPAMPTEPKKPLFVISYAQADEPEHPAEGQVMWLSFVTGYLRPAIKRGADVATCSDFPQNKNYSRRSWKRGGR